MDQAPPSPSPPGDPPSGQTNAQTSKSSSKASTVRHTRAIQRDRSKRPPSPPPDAAVTERLTELIHPATLAQVDHFRALGLRERTLTLPVMVALVLSLVWRQVASLAELQHWRPAGRRGSAPSRAGGQRPPGQRQPPLQAIEGVPVRQQPGH